MERDPIQSDPSRGGTDPCPTTAGTIKGSMKHRRWLAALVPFALVAAACSSTPGSSAAATKLTIAAVQGVEDAGLKALAPMYTAKTGVKINIVEAPYDSLYTKLVTAFGSNDATYDLFMMDDPWMPKFGTMGALSDLGAMGVTKDPDVAQIVWDVGTWPPPHGPVPPSEKSKPAQLLGRDDRRQRRDVHVPQGPHAHRAGVL